MIEDRYLGFNTLTTRRILMESSLIYTHFLMRVCAQHALLSNTEFLNDQCDQLSINYILTDMYKYQRNNIDYYMKI